MMSVSLVQCTSVRDEALAILAKLGAKESAFAPIVQPQNIIVLHKGVTGYVISPLDVQGDMRWVKKS